MPNTAPRLALKVLFNAEFHRVNFSSSTMLHSNRPYLYNVDEGDYNGIVLPTPKRRKIWTVDGTSLDNLDVADELNTDDYRASIHPSSWAPGTRNGISAHCSPVRATEAGDVDESKGKAQKICFGMVRYYRSSVATSAHVSLAHRIPDGTFEAVEDREEPYGTFKENGQIVIED